MAATPAAAAAAAAAAEAAGNIFSKTVSDYHITRKLGSGKFGEVRAAFNTATNEQLAVKIVLRSKLTSKKDVDHINREITYMKVLSHPFVVQLREALQTTNNIYLFMELVEGGDLIDRIGRERLTEARARKYFQQLVVGVRYCHANKIAHRDLKLDNLLLDKKDNIKVADFGLANLATVDPMMHTIVGSPHYVAPEVLRVADEPRDSSLGYDGFGADLWSMGVILFTLLSGHYPFDDENRRTLFNKITAGDFRMSRSFTPASANLVQNLLVVDPAKRYTINDILNDPWFKVDFDPALLALGGAAVPVAPQSPLNVSMADNDPRLEAARCAAIEARNPTNPRSRSPILTATADAAKRPVAFWFRGDSVDACMASVCEALRRMGCLFQDPDAVVGAAGARVGTARELVAYRNKPAPAATAAPGAAAGAPVQIFQVGVWKTEPGAQSCAVAVEPRGGDTSEFAALVRALFESLGAKVSDAAI